MIDRRESSISMLLHGEGASISAALINGIKYNTEVLPYKDWQQGFLEGLQQMKSEDGLRVASFQDRFNDISRDYGGSEDSLADSPAYRNLVNQIRGKGVQRVFDYERFFAENSSNDTASKILGGYQSDGSYHTWTNDELNTLSESNRIMADPSEYLGKRIIYEGHHGGAGISRTPIGDIERMYNPDNIRIMTPKGHLQHGHDGKWINPPKETYSDITDRSDRIRAEERAELDRDSNLDEIAGIAIGLAAGSISAILKYRELSKDPFPMNRKKAFIIAGSFLSGAATGVIPFVLLNEISTPVRNLVEESLSDIFLGGGDIAKDTLIDNLADASGDFLIIMSAIVARSLIQGGIQGFQHGFSIALRNFGSTIARTSVEQGAFFVLQLVLDSLTPIPDPVLGPTVTVLRVSYSLTKIALSVKQRKEIAGRRLDSLYDAAYAVAIG